MNEVKQFEKIIADFYGSTFAVAVDCCTHAIELCLRMLDDGNMKYVTCPKHTYLSVPMTFQKLDLCWEFDDTEWEDYYYIQNTPIVDAAVYWKRNGYISNTLMCLSFQFKKHLNLGRGGMILLDNEEQYNTLRKMRYDGRKDDTPWALQDIDTFGYHYYMTPETAEKGIIEFSSAEKRESKKWSYRDYPNLSKMKVFDDWSY
jgi:dTDP-4-amino-4,6-dideoxygalactose transaminase